MLIAVLLVVLILVILFREEIRGLVGLLIGIGFMYALWESGSVWGKVVVVAIVLLFVGAFVGGMISGARELQAASTDKSPELQPQQQPQPAEPEGWYCWVNGQQLGPYTEEELLNRLRSRTLPPETQIRHSRVPTWAPANQLWAGRF